MHTYATEHVKGFYIKHNSQKKSMTLGTSRSWVIFQGCAVHELIKNTLNAMQAKHLPNAFI